MPEKGVQVVQRHGRICQGKYKREQEVFQKKHLVKILSY